MKRLTNTVTGEVSNNSVAKSLGVGLDCSAYYVDWTTWHNRCDCTVEWLFSSVNKQGDFFRNIANFECLITVPVEAIQIAYAQALLVDKAALAAAQNNNDVVQAQEILQAAFRTDVRPMVAEARYRTGGALEPMTAFRELKVRENLIRERGSKSTATGL